MGYHHACAIDSGQAIRCWGENYYGEATPPTGNFSQVDAGEDHTCAIATDSTLSCWGRNDDGQLAAPGGSYSDLQVGNGFTCASAASRRFPERYPTDRPAPDSKPSAAWAGEGTGCAGWDALTLYPALAAVTQGLGRVGWKTLKRRYRPSAELAERD